jgi:DNA-binding NtrC family response regulator
VWTPAARRSTVATRFGAYGARVPTAGLAPSERGPDDVPVSRSDDRSAHSAGGPDAPSADLGAWAAFERALGRAARTDATVLLTGESGSGKTRAAERLHSLGPRAQGPFVAVHVAGLAPTLLEAELFGHEEGAYTGARGARTGRFQRASGGTVVLEGIEALALDLQVKLLRVLQERVVEPLGGSAPVPVDVRIVATSALDLPSEVAAGRFRGDLYYRLAVVPLTVPPLRMRTGELPRLCDELARTAAQRLGVPPLACGVAALERLAAHPWPGNVRELENALERALVLAAGAGTARAELGPEDFEFLDEELAGAAERLAREALAHGVGADELLDALVEAALEQERGNASAAARRIGLTRRAVEYRRARGAKEAS